MLQVRSDRRDASARSASTAAAPAQPSENYLNPDAENRALPSKLTMTIKRGDVFRHVLAGARRLGRSAGARSRGRAARRAQRASVGRRRRAADYGVVRRDTEIGPSTSRDDEAAREIRAARGWREVPKVQWRRPVPPQAAE